MEQELEMLGRALQPFGLIVRGGFHPQPEDCVPPLTNGRPAGTVVLIGNAGPALWRVFGSQTRTGSDHPLNQWTEEVMSRVAGEHGAAVWFPFGGPPYHPFQRWAARAESVWSSPIGILIHPQFGLWHAYRAALGLTEKLELPPRPAAASPCLSCVDQPCLTTCPVSAFAHGGYDVAACRAHLATSLGEDCMSLGCRARRACPVARDCHYEPEQAQFHMRAFLHPK